MNLEAIVEGFNVLDRSNLQLPNGTLNPSISAPRCLYG